MPRTYEEPPGRLVRHILLAADHEITHRIGEHVDELHPERTDGSPEALFLACIRGVVREEVAPLWDRLNALEQQPLAHTLPHYGALAIDEPAQISRRNIALMISELRETGMLDYDYWSAQCGVSQDRIRERLEEIGRAKTARA